MNGQSPLALLDTGQRLALFRDCSGVDYYTNEKGMLDLVRI